MAISNTDILRLVIHKASQEAGKWERELEANPTRKRIDEWEHYMVRSLHYRQVAAAAESLIALTNDNAPHPAIAAICRFDTLDELVRYCNTDVRHRRAEQLDKLPSSTLKLYDKQEIADEFERQVNCGDYNQAYKLVRLTAAAFRNIGSIPDFYPTPTDAAYEMVIRSGARDDENSVNLEPHGGMGDLAAVMQREYPSAKLWVIERQFSLAELLKAKGYNVVGDDFLEFTTPVDHIIMNPPFSNGNDAKHIRHAYDVLRPGGSLVSLAAQSIDFQTRGEYRGFREWWASVGGRMERLRPGIFKGKGIDINPMILWLEEKILPDPVPGQSAPGESDQAAGDVAATAALEGGVRPKRKRSKAGREAVQA